MKAIAIGVSAVLFLAGCGGGPKCTDPAARSAFMDGCTYSGNATWQQCTCAFDELAYRYACEDVGQASFNELREIVEMCQ